MITLELGKMLRHEIIALDQELHFLKKKYTDEDIDFQVRTKKVDQNWSNVTLTCNSHTIVRYIRMQVT